MTNLNERLCSFDQEVCKSSQYEVMSISVQNTSYCLAKKKRKMHVITNTEQFIQIFYAK